MSAAFLIPSETAQHVRQVLKAAVQAGSLRSGTYRVRVRSYTPRKRSRQAWFALDLQVMATDFAVIDPHSAFACVLRGEGLKWTLEAYVHLKHLSNLMLGAVAGLHEKAAQRPQLTYQAPAPKPKFAPTRCTVTYSPDLLAAQQAQIMESLAPKEPEPIRVRAADLAPLLGKPSPPAHLG